MRMLRVVSLVAGLLLPLVVSAQTARWVYAYNGPGDNWDWASAVVRGPDGCIHAAGMSAGEGTDDDFAVVSVTSDGGERWVYVLADSAGASHEDWASAIAVHWNGDVYAAGYAQVSDTIVPFTVVSLTSAGRERWVYQHRDDDPWEGPSDELCGIAIGPNGNVYAAGCIAGKENEEGGDFAVVSLDTAGSERWVFRYAGTADDDDCAYAIVCGPDGSVYAAGRTEDDAGCDFTVISLDSSGLRRWVYRYQGEGFDRGGFSIVFGEDGNLYVAGETSPPGRGGAFTVISLDTDGRERWVYQNNQPNTWDHAASVVYGPDGRVYAAGFLNNEGMGEMDFAVVALDTAGSECWVYTYHGPVRGRNGANAVACDSAGRVVACGMSQGRPGRHDFDFVVIGLDTAGQECWVHRRVTDRTGDANAVLCDPGGDVYAVGYAFGEVGEEPNYADLTVVGLTQAGQERWVYCHNGPGNGNDEAHCIALGPGGDVYVGGQRWGNSTDGDFTVVSLSGEGQERWVYSYVDRVTLGKRDKVNAVVCGADGNIYATGEVVTPDDPDPCDSDILVVSLTDDGAERWTYRYNGHTYQGEGGDVVIWGGDSNVYVGGRCTGEDYTALAVISLTPQGTENWFYRYDGPGRTGDGATAMFYGQDSNVYVAGYAGGGGHTYDFAALSVTRTGQQRWVYTRNGTEDWYDQAKGIVEHPDGSVIVAGYLWNTTTGTYVDAAVVSLSRDGEEQWFYEYNGPAWGWDDAYSVTCDSAGNIYTAGSSWNGGDFDILVVSLDSTGQERWVYQYNGPANRDDLGDAICCGADGNLYVIGLTKADEPPHNWVIISLDTTGQERWTYTYCGPRYVRDEPYAAMVCGPDTNLYAAGNVWNRATYTDIGVISLATGAVRVEEPGRTRAAELSVPTVFRDKVNITVRAPVGTPVTTSLYSISGARVFTGTFRDGGSCLVLEQDRIGALPVGAYFLIVSSQGREIGRAKLVKVAR